ncbi:MAG: O-antigen ligase family protein [Deltaproteobacteria bacterium]|nr:O-antigen ligase family protein [Deltaproteobacteria bacterium]
MGCIALGILSSGRLGIVWGKTGRTSIRVLYFYYGLCLLSFFWSILPVYSAYRAVEFLVMLTGILVAFSYEPDFASAERRILFVSFVVILFTLFVSYRLYGFTFSLLSWHTNSYTATAGMMFCYCLGEYFTADDKRKAVLKKYGLVGLFFLFFGTSSASFFAALAGVTAITILKRKYGLLFACTMILATSLLVGYQFDLIKEIVFYGKQEHEIETLGGRLPMWENLVEVARERLYLGHGFAVISTGRGNVFASRPHNSLFSILLGTGVMGMLVFLFYALRLLKEVFVTSTRRVPGAVGCAAAIAMALVNSLANPLIFDQFEESTLVFVSISVFFALFVLPASKNSGHGSV